MRRRSTDFQPDPATAEAVRWPSTSFLLGAIKRQFLLASFLTIPVFFAVLYGLSRFPLEYSSSISVIFDTSESMNAGDSLPVIVNRISGAYTSRFTDPEFMKRILQSLPAGTLEESAPSSFSIRKVLQKYLPKNLQPAAWNLPPQEQRTQEQVDELTSKLTATAVTGQYTLTLLAKDASPERARLIVRHAMDEFIKDNLSQRLQQAQAKSKELAALQANVFKEKEAPSEYENAEGSSIVTSLEDRRALKNKEQLLVKEILIKKADFDRAQATQESKLLLLNEELNNLLSRKGVTHPEVVQKQREINKLKAEPVDTPIEAHLNRLKGQLYNLQRDMKQRGIPIDRSVQISYFPDETRRSLADIASQLHALDNQISELQSEIAAPSSSRRFTTVREAELPTTPSNKKQFLLGIGLGLFLCALTFAMTILIREMNQPQVVAPEQLERLYGVQPTASVQASWVKRHPVFDADEIRQLKPQLGELSTRKRPELLLLDSYRHLGQLVDQMRQHQITVVFDTGSKNHPDNLAANLTKVLAVDSGRRALLLSFRGRDSGNAETTADLMQFLAGKAEWKDVRFKGSLDGSHDTAFARDPLESLGAFKEDLMQRLLLTLRDKYQLIIIEAFPPAFNNENGILHELADAVVLQIRLGETRHEDLQRLLQFMDRRKIAAALMT